MAPRPAAWLSQMDTISAAGRMTKTANRIAIA